MAGFIAQQVQGLVHDLQDWYTAATWSENDIPDLTGKTILVTGATDGVGFEAARAFAQKGAHVVIHGRNAEKAHAVLADIRRWAAPHAKLDVLIADLTDFRAIKAMADDYKSRGWPLHVLLNNAGIQAPAGHLGQKTPGGFEVTMSSNFFGPFYLTLQLLDVLKATAPSRIVWVNSVGSQLVNPPYIGGNSWAPGIDWFFWPGMNWDDLKGEHYPTSDWWQYSRTKLMNLMCAKEQARRLAGSGVEVFCAHPGLTRTDHFGKADTDAKWSSAGVERFANSFWGTEARHGAIPLMYACTAKALHGRTGAYVGSMELGPVNYMQAGEIKRPNAPLARDPWACSRLYDATLAILKQVDLDLPHATISNDGDKVVQRYLRQQYKDMQDLTSSQGGASLPLPLPLPIIGTIAKLLMGPRSGGLGIHDAQNLTGRSAAPLGRRPAPYLSAIRNLFMEHNAEPAVHVRGQDRF